MRHWTFGVEQIDDACSFVPLGDIFFYYLTINTLSCVYLQLPGGWAEKNEHIEEE